MNRNTKVLFVTNSVTGGGAEISVGRIFQALRARDLTVKICAINQSEILSTYDSDYQIIGRSWNSGLIQTTRSILRFRRYLREENFQLLVANCELPELFIAVAGTKISHIIAVEHTSKPWKGRTVMGIAVRLILKVKGTIWVTVSSNQKSIWPFRQRPIYIPNPHIIYPKKEFLSETDLVFVGRLNSAKNPELVARAAQALGKSISFFGDGPLLGKMINEFESPSCNFMGFIENPWSEISCKSTLVVASEYEGDGMNIVEAVINGNPILLADNPDLRRFRFPDQVYFSDFNELLRKISEIDASQSSRFNVDSETVTRLAKERNLDSIADLWSKLIGRLKLG